jgi:glycosyltransferase involved in cell wall biosynthesis
MNILSLAPTSFFGDYGCHVRILEEARALQAQGHQVTVLTYYKGANVPGLNTLRTAPTPWHKDYEVGSSRHKFAFDVLLAVSLIRELTRTRYDMIHAHLHEGALIGSVIGRLFRVPVCFDFQGSLTDEMVMHRFVRKNSLAYRLFQRVEQLANRLPDGIVTSTRHAAETLRVSAPAGKPVQALPDGVNTAVCHPGVYAPGERDALRAAHGIGPDDVVACYLGLLAEHQGIGNLIEAAALLKAQGVAVKWLVMGYPGVGIWRAAAEAAGVADTVQFTGRVPYENMPKMVGLGDIALAPKLSLTEGSGKILNYMAMALPTVAFDTPAQREILGPLGVYAPMGDSAALAAEVRVLAQSPGRRKELGWQLRQRVTKDFSWERNAGILADVYARILARRGVPAAIADPAHADDR